MSHMDACACCSMGVIGMAYVAITERQKTRGYMGEER